MSYIDSFLRYLVTILILFSGLLSISQENNNCLLGSCEASLDTADIKRVHRFRNSMDYVNLGNIGLPGYHLIFDAKERSSFNWIRMIGSKNYPITTYDVKSPYTKILYVLGAKEEQYLSLLHTQNISSRANFSVGFDKVNSEGMYLNQAADNNHFYSNIWFKSKSERYKMIINFDHERLFNELNGGIVYDSVFEQNLLLNRNRQLADIYLDYGSSNIKRAQLDLIQQFVFSSNLDSLGKGSEHSLVLQGTGKRSSRNFKDSILNLDYYTSINIDSTITKDSLGFKSIIGSLGYQWKKVGESNVLVQAKGYTELLNYETLITDTNYQDVGVKLAGNWSKNSTSVYGAADYHLEGVRKGDMNAELGVKYALGSNWGVHGSFLTSSISPSLDLESYYGNHSSWTNNFSQTNYLSFSGEIINKKLQSRFKLSYTDISSPIVINYIGEPQQLNGVAQLVQTELSKRIEFGNWELLPKAVYQYTGGYDIYQLPDLFGELTIGYSLKAFKKKMNLFLGADIWYASSYNALAFNPVVGNYMINTSKSIGNYPMVDLYMNGKIKTVRFFFKMNHINAGLPGYTYYSALNQPLRDRAFQIGVSWEFYD